MQKRRVAGREGADIAASAEADMPARLVNRSVTMLRLHTRRRALIADKVADIANLITAAVVIGFVIGGSAASGAFVVGAIAVWLALLSFAVWIEEEHS